ncbi:hypothetical protein M1615_00245 [Patescibacteria group bacterium]|nr:hypothetical protein [Patescibacteria group bacterium]
MLVAVKEQHDVFLILPVIIVIAGSLKAVVLTAVPPANKAIKEFAMKAMIAMNMNAGLILPAVNVLVGLMGLVVRLEAVRLVRDFRLELVLLPAVLLLLNV